MTPKSADTIKQKNQMDYLPDTVSLVAAAAVLNQPLTDLSQNCIKQFLHSKAETFN